MSVGTPLEESKLLKELEKTVHFSEMLDTLRADEPLINFLYHSNFLAVAQCLSVQNFPLAFNHTNAAGESIVHQVAQRAEFNWLFWLCTQDKTDLFIQTDIHRNIFHYSAHVQDRQFLELLFSLTKDKNIVFLKDKLNKFPLTLAIEYDNELFLEFLVSYFKEELLDFKDAIGQNCLHYIALFNATKCYKLLEKSLTPAELDLLKDARNTQGKKPVMFAKAISDQNGNRTNVYELMMGYGDEVSTLQRLAAMAICPYEESDDVNETLSRNFVPFHLSEIVGDARSKREAITKHENEITKVVDQSDDEYPTYSTPSP